MAASAGRESQYPEAKDIANVSTGGKRAIRQQYAALPLTVSEDGERRVLLITSRETGRWIIPKGWAEKGVEPHVLAAREAYEEAGLEGQIGSEPIGRYRYMKWLRRKKRPKWVWCDVAVFVLLVQRQLADWPEKGQRERRSFGMAEAARVADDGGLALLLSELEPLAAWTRTKPVNESSGTVLPTYGPT